MTIFLRESTLTVSILHCIYIISSGPRIELVNEKGLWNLWNSHCITDEDYFSQGKEIRLWQKEKGRSLSHN